MKELTIEQKAKAYDKAIERAKRMFSEKELSYLFPELKESEGEMVRKEMIDFLQETIDNVGEAPNTWTMQKAKEWIAWIEKQGKSDKIVERAKTEKQRVLITESDGEANIDWDAHSLADTKMLLEYGLDFINKKFEKEGEQKPYGQRKECLDCQFNYAGECKGSCQMKRDEQKPIEWKQENREELTEFENAMMHIGGSFFGENAGLDPNDTAAIKEQAELLLKLAPKTEWSEEDEKIRKSLLRWLQSNSYTSIAGIQINDVIAWLKSLRPQINVTDEELAQAKKEAYNEVLDKIEYHDDWPTFDDGWNAAIWYLKKRNDSPQSHWTPSDAQIQALKEACDKSWEPDGLDPLYTLYEDLKRLKE